MDRKPVIRILRPGTFTSVEGKSVTFGQRELEDIAANYDAESDPAPLVIGHPKMDDPAFGWVGSLSVENGELIARPDMIEASFAEQVRGGAFRKVSARLYEPDNPHNPKPGQYYLKHVGFLGAHAPGVKGLGTVQFAEGDADKNAVTIEFQGQAKSQSPATPQTQMENDMSDKSKDGAGAGAGASAGVSADDAAKQASFAEREKALADREQALKTQEAAQKKAAADARHDANVGFAEGLIGEAKLAPAGKDLLVGVLDHLGELSADATISFGEGENIRADAALKKLLGSATPLISLGEAAAPDKKGAKAGLASFAAPAGYEVDAGQAPLYAAAKAIQAANPKLAWMDCVKQAQGAM